MPFLLNLNLNFDFVSGSWKKSFFFWCQVWRMALRDWNWLWSRSDRLCVCATVCGFCWFDGYLFHQYFSLKIFMTFHRVLSVCQIIWREHRKRMKTREKELSRDHTYRIQRFRFVELWHWILKSCWEILERERERWVHRIRRFQDLTRMWKWLLKDIYSKDPSGKEKQEDGRNDIIDSTTYVSFFSLVLSLSLLNKKKWSHTHFFYK